MERFLPPAGGSSAPSMVACGEPTCPMKSSLITAVHKCPCGRAMHGFCGRGIGEEGFGQQRECTDCQRRSSGDKVGTSSSPMEVNPEDGEQEKVREQARREEAPAGGKGPLRTGTQKKRPQVGAGGSTTATAKKGKKSNPQAEVGKKELTMGQRQDDDSGGKLVSCITSPLTEAEAHSCFEKLRAYLYANGRNGEFSETLYLLSKSVHSFTHENQKKRRAKRGGEIQATLRDVWQA